ncbi:hypothetical protein NQ176_g1210 [Zarea fungicola]|uniref:Uncharacterized protein n=1 Tax=Zarea fungicola TaxID=93591 RepID=A0ACC1NVW9_9HYPO|nr:hypothetical protein NQ176_g1210 [Lecanicillium fungicola]
MPGIPFGALENLKNKVQELIKKRFDKKSRVTDVKPTDDKPADIAGDGAPASADDTTTTEHAAILPAVATETAPATVADTAPAAPPATDVPKDAVAETPAAAPAITTEAAPESTDEVPAADKPAQASAAPTATGTV